MTMMNRAASHASVRLHSTDLSCPFRISDRYEPTVARELGLVHIDVGIAPSRTSDGCSWRDRIPNRSADKFLVRALSSVECSFHDTQHRFLVAGPVPHGV